MQLREKKGHSSSELGMTSMTDIIFILLMFFMMTSTLTAPSALPLLLPGRSRAADRLSTQRIPRIAIFEDGTYRLDGRNAELPSIEGFLTAQTQGTTQKVNVVVAPDDSAPVESVVAILDITTKLGIDAVLSVDN